MNSDIIYNNTFEIEEPKTTLSNHYKTGRKMREVTKVCVK